MSAFARTTFNSKAYLKSRPTYPQQLYDQIAQYFEAHNPSAADTTVVDIGCGPGATSIPLLDIFDNGVGFDNSSNMVQAAKDEFSSSHSIEFKQGDDKTFVNNMEAASADAVTVAQAIHWFDPAVFFPNVYKVLKPNGILAFWGYVDQRFVGSQRATEIHRKYSYHKEYLGPYWEPGRAVLRNMLRDIQPPPSMFKDEKRYEHNVDLADSGPAGYKLKQHVTLDHVADHMKTASAYHAWKETNPNEPDMVDEFEKEMEQELGWSGDTPVELEYSTILVLATKQ